MKTILNNFFECLWPAITWLLSVICGSFSHIPEAFWASLLGCLVSFVLSLFLWKLQDTYTKNKLRQLYFPFVRLEIKSCISQLEAAKQTNGRPEVSFWYTNSLELAKVLSHAEIKALTRWIDLCLRPPQKSYLIYDEKEFNYDMLIEEGYNLLENVIKYEFHK